MGGSCAIPALMEVTLKEWIERFVKGCIVGSYDVVPV
jgi:hypothetical protein